MLNEDVKAGERLKEACLDILVFFPISPKFEFLKIKHKIDFTKKLFIYENR